MGDAPQSSVRALWIVLGGIILGFLFIGYLRDERVLVHAFDTGIYLQLAHNFFTYGSLDSSLTGETNFLAHHFQPVILLFSPFIATFPRPMTLFILSAIAIVLSMVCAVSLCPKDRSKTVAGLVFLGVIVHPAVSERLFYGFVPEILALPALTWMALQLVGEPRQQKPWPWFLALCWILICKEPFFLMAAIVALTMSLRSQKKALWYSCAAACITGFLLLFFWWMPHHSLLPHYYGLSYYFPEGQILGEGSVSIFRLITQLVSNTFSMATVTTIFNVAWMTAFLPFLGWSLALIPALFGLLLILCSASGIVHHPANHYLIPALPFLAAAALENIGRWQNRVPSLTRFVVVIAVILLPLSYTALHEGGALYALSVISARPKTAFYEEDLAKVASLIPEDESLLVSGNLQPHLARYRNTRIILDFTGNPLQMDDVYLKSAHWVVSTDDIKKIEDCRLVAAGGRGLEINSESFVKVCERVKGGGEVVAQFPDSGLIVYKLLAI